MVKYIPKQKDVITLDFSPIKGHEQQGYRPAVVISTNVFNDFTNMAMVLPISSNDKEFPTHYKLINTNKISGSVLCEHVRSIDYNNRKVKYLETLSDEDFLAIYNLFISCLED